MSRAITAVYEHGVIRPTQKLPFSEHQKIELLLEIPKSIVRATKAVIRIRPKVGKLIAESPAFNPLES